MEVKTFQLNSKNKRKQEPDFFSLTILRATVRFLFTDNNQFTHKFLLVTATGKHIN